MDEKAVERVGVGERRVCCACLEWVCATAAAAAERQRHRTLVGEVFVVGGRVCVPIFQDKNKRKGYKHTFF